MAKSLGEVYMKFSVKDGQVVVQQLDKIEGGLQRMGKTGQQAGDRLAKGFKMLGALPGILGIWMIAAQIRGLENDAIRAEEGMNRLRGALAARGIPMFAADEMKKVADQLERASTFDADEIVAGMATAVTAGGDWNRLLQDMDGLLGMVYISGRDLNEVMRAYALIQQGNIEGVGRLLTTFGLVGTEEEKIAEFLQQLTAYRGKAQEGLRTETGLVKASVIQWQNVREEMGKVVSKGMRPLLEILMPLMIQLQQGPPQLRALATAAYLGVPAILALAMAMRSFGASGKTAGWVGVLLAVLGAVAALGLGGSREMKAAEKATKASSDEMGEWSKKAKESGDKAGYWGERIEEVRERIQSLKEEIAEAQRQKAGLEEPGTVIIHGEVSADYSGQFKRNQLAENLIGLQAELTAGEEQLTDAQDMQNLAVAVEKGDRQAELAIQIRQLEISIRKGQTSLKDAKDQLVTMRDAAKTDEERLDLEGKILDIGERIQMQRQKEISESEHRRMLVAQIADSESGRHDAVMAVTREIIEERKARGGTIGVMEKQLELLGYIADEEARVKAGIEAEIQKRKELSAAYDAVMGQYKEAAAAKAGFEWEFKLVTPEEQIERLAQEIETLTGIRPEMKIESFQEIAAGIQALGEEGNVEGMNRVSAAMQQWYDLSTTLPPEMQVLQSAAERLASSFEGAFVEVFKEGKLSLQSFEKAFQMMIANMAATIASRAAIFGLLSLFIPGGSAFWGGTGVIGKIFGFQHGGYTGHGRPDEVAGVVHREEVVLPLRDKKRTFDLIGAIVQHLGGNRPILSEAMFPPAMAMAGPAGQTAELRSEIVGLRKEFRELRNEIARQPEPQVILQGKFEVTLDALRFRLAEAERRAGNRGI